MQCLICLDEYEPEDDIRVMTCRHAFHKSCVDKWLQTGRNNCPACRTPVCLSLAFLLFNAFLITVVGCFDGWNIANTLALDLRRLIFPPLSSSFTLHIPIHHDLESTIAPYHCFPFSSLVNIAIVVSNSPSRCYHSCILLEKLQHVFTKTKTSPFSFPPLFLSYRIIVSLFVYCSTCYLEWTIKNKIINFPPFSNLYLQVQIKCGWTSG
jgi:hypothetical protein